MELHPTTPGSMKNFLKTDFSEWIGCHGVIDRPPHSCDFSMWGTAKQDVFSKQPRDLITYNNILQSLKNS
jgi:hypothetical protein